MQTDVIEQTVEAGISPLELVYYPVKTTARKENAGLKAVLRINSIELGTLEPKQYSVVANRTVQSVKLATWAFKKLFEDISSMKEAGVTMPGHVIIYSPVRMLMKGNLDKLLSAAEENGFDFFRGLYIEFPSALLLEDADEAAKIMNELKSKFGVKFVLGEFGDAFCPTFRISGFPLDMVILDESISDEISLDSLPVRSAVKLINDLNMTSVLYNTSADSAINKAFSTGCSRYISDYGRTVSEVLNGG